MAEGVEVQGLDRLTSTLARLARDLPAIAPPRAAQIIGQEARQRAPKRTGRLAASFGADSGDGVLSMRFGAAYANPVHWGTGPRPGLRGPHNIRPTRFLTDAVADLEAAWSGIYEDAVADAVARVQGA